MTTPGSMAGREGELLFFSSYACGAIAIAPYRTDPLALGKISKKY
jgi:hypothetical protein